ncbi:hypothetical protein GGS23DRAFT_339758 [Durotheca rogersii]|uniref:uncharacterized protein n=1 Tax=Durotheca rogersii TaxID=419775 RepID=UPI00221F663B|nr:uncharacterized protein GGS23DRAFT_339758 [Durotheca rogersii]KAI5858224.1 hypothetical protein GGS23DRAFT_339758 [Durotheca rogersii]
MMAGCSSFLLPSPLLGLPSTPLPRPTSPTPTTCLHTPSSTSMLTLALTLTHTQAPTRRPSLPLSLSTDQKCCAMRHVRLMTCQPRFDEKGKKREDNKNLPRTPFLPPSLLGPAALSPTPMPHMAPQGRKVHHMCVVCVYARAHITYY